MDDELLQLEAELKRLRPRAPSPAIRAQIERQFAAEAPRRVVVRFPRYAWLALPAAAAVAGLLVFNAAPRRDIPSEHRSQSSTSRVTREPVASSVAQFKPVAARDLLLESQDEGVVTLADGTPARRTRESHLDTITWKDPRTNASVTWSVPRDEVRVVPISYE